MKRKDKDIEFIEKLYNYIERDLENVNADMSCDFLTENFGRDGNDYYWYFDGDTDVAINEKDGTIIDNEKTIEELFC